ncbi:YdcF family protein [Cohnella sp. CFH 77786]|uniref:YdcF family protein n=1 Tax=Cohnella sp. CFH 77786 TaxID=2662265 RepID=UPI001C60A548|nr:YdcF family protein [Cohnella sp. CFH 77786]MBW5445348.1 YdcF family protein [Cohnella sp. CFH 77786]
MLYLIKFLYSFVLPPGLFIILFAVLGVWIWIRGRRRTTGIAILAVTIMLYLSSTGLVSGEVMRSLERDYPPPAKIDGDVIVVLGGGATADTPDIDGQGNLLGSAANRLLAAARLHFQTGLPILFSGGQVYADTGNEADIAKRQLIGLNVPVNRIFVENRSLNTEQNAEYVGRMLQQLHWKKPVLVTSAFHMKRSVLQFEKAGMTVQPYPVDYHVSERGVFGLNKLSPSSEALSNMGASLREYLGIAAARLKS